MRLQDEAFLVQHDLMEDGWRSRTAAWTKPQALRLYHELLQRYREWNEPDVGVDASTHSDEDVEVAVYRYSSDEDSDGSDSEVIEFVTPRVREDAGGNAQLQGGEDNHLAVDEGATIASSDYPRESWIQPVLGQRPSCEDELTAEDNASKHPSATVRPLRRHRVRLSTSHSQDAQIRPAHVRHVEAAQSNLAALHWRLLREERADALGALNAPTLLLPLAILTLADI